MFPWKTWPFCAHSHLPASKSLVKGRKRNLASLPGHLSLSMKALKKVYIDFIVHIVQSPRAQGHTST